MSVIQHLWRGRRVRVAGAVEQVAVDCPDDLAAIYRDYWDLVYRRCLATLGDDHAAQDATQDVFLMALSNFEEVQHDIVRGLLDMARTISYERRRRPAREVMLPNPPYTNGHADDPAEIAERHGVLDAIWSGLSPVERRYVADKFAGFSFEEIAKRNRRKLGTVSSNLFRAREHARNLRGSTLPALLGAAGWRRLTDLCRRARTTAHSSAVSAGAQPVQALTISLTVVGLLAVGSPAAGAGVAGGATRPLAVTPPMQLDTGDPAAVAQADGIAAAAAQPVGYAAAPSAGTHGGATALPLPASATSETPEDTVIYTATPSPNYENDHTILAIGRGKSCACPVLLRSLDGGATWTASSGVPQGDEIVLPPAYPRDPRIFIGYQYESPGINDWWAPSFDQPFQPLLGPAGALALPAGFDSGDQRVIVSAANGVWSENLTTGLVEPLLVETPPSSSTAVATPLGATGVLAMTDSAAVATGAPPTATTPTGLTLWACPLSQPCQAQGEVPMTLANGMVTSPAFATDHTLAVFGPASVMASTDGGRSFTPMSVPAATSSILMVALGFGDQATASTWLVVEHGSTFSLDFATTVHGGWHDVSDGLAQITSAGGRVIPLAPHSALFLSGNGGLLCTSNDGETWAPRCSAA